MAAKEEGFEDKLQRFVNELRQQTMLSSYYVALTTVNLIKEIVCAEDKWINARNLMELLKNEGRKLILAQPTATIAGNMVKRVLKIIRENYDLLKYEREMNESEREKDRYDTKIPKLRDRIIDCIADLLDEIDQSSHSIAVEAVNHIHMNEVVMTIGKSNTVEKFLKSAAEKRRFHVIVAEGAPFYQGHELALGLAKANIETTIITDSAIFAMMSRVNKVIIGTHCVLANGGLKAVNGSYALALAAKNYSVPLIVCTATYKLSPQYLCSIDQVAFNRFTTPQGVIEFSEVGMPSDGTHISNPVFDYVPPELVNLFIFSNGGNAPSYIYRLLSEMYHPDDYNFETERFQ